MLPLRFALRSRGIRFPAFSGSIWHGGLGMVLAMTAPQAFGVLYQTDSDVRLYSPLPPAEEVLPAQTVFKLGITLYGAEYEYAVAVTEVIAQLGHRGLEPGGRYELLRAELITPNGPVLLADASHGLLRQPEPGAAHDYLDTASRSMGGCTLRFATPLRIKESNHFVTSTPSCEQLLHRTLGRVEQLAYAAGEASPLFRAARTAPLAEAQRVEISKSRLSTIQIQRRSARALQQIQFSGLTGTVECCGTMALTLPWLKIATLTQVGGKTAFGFGVIDILELKEE
jgi:hypothetical protein